ncbi:hypothetical protein ACGGZK_08055 [Agromyces sp. MMS24-K17]|uniref:hypothetical protein n=1 Tax=Agromyces sp. MMS24-K17 TaxID=3372850 RepID=UPI0037551087
MSTNPAPNGRPSPAVYRRRRLVVLLGLLAVVVAIVLIIVRPGSSQGDEADRSAPPATETPAATDAAATEAPATDAPAADGSGTALPTESASAEGKHCKSAQVAVEAVTDRTEYAAGEQPQLSMTLTNTGADACVLNVGTKVQEFTIKSGEEVYWRSTDCQGDPFDADVLLEPGKPVSSAVPIIWDRTRSAPDTCGIGREAVPAGGASYHLTVLVDGIESAESKQFLLY